MKIAIESIKNEVIKTQALIDYYLNRGDPSIEILQPNQFQKLEELQQVLSTLKKYS